MSINNERETETRHFERFMSRLCRSVLTLALLYYTYVHDTNSNFIPRYTKNAFFNFNNDIRLNNKSKLSFFIYFYFYISSLPLSQSNREKQIKLVE